MRVLFAGGGTAGHINPALAAAGYLRSKQPDAEILYVGNKGGMEERLVPAAGYDFKTIRISGFQRKLTAKNIRRNIKTVFRLFSSSVESERIIKAFKPDICVGTGGYVSGPVIRAAQKLGIPTVIHEQNAYPGMTTKALAKHAECVSPWRTRKSTSTAKITASSPATRCAFPFCRPSAKPPARR